MRLAFPQDVFARLVELDPSAGRQREEIGISASIDGGSLEIFLPEGVGINGTASVDAGEVSEPGRASAGLGDPSLDWTETGELGTVLLDAHVNLGNIEIHR